MSKILNIENCKTFKHAILQEIQKQFLFTKSTENLLRQDLLLKLNYANIMEVPRLCKIIVVIQRKFPHFQNIVFSS
jgi:hypothetical protein